MVRLLAYLIEFLVLLALIAVAIGFFGRWYFVADLLCHFRIQATFCLILAGFVLWPMLRRRSSMVALIAGLGLLTTMMPFIWPSPIEAGSYRLLSMNVLTRNSHKELVADYIKEQDPDFVLLQEVDQIWCDSMNEALIERWPHTEHIPRGDNSGLALFSKFPLKQSEVKRYCEEFSTPTLVADIELPDQKPLRLFVVHPLPPVGDAQWRSRNHFLENLAKDLQSRGSQRTIVAGDLNCTPWSPYFSGTLTASGLKNSAVGHGLAISWFPSSKLPIGLPIDHVLVGRDIEVGQHQIGPFLGSDHRPVTVEFQ